MANRLVGNVYIIDSALNNVALPWPQGAKISSVLTWLTAQDSEVVFSDAVTSDILIRLVHGLSSGISNQYIHFPGGLRVDNLKVPILVTGSAWIYLL